MDRTVVGLFVRRSQSSSAFVQDFPCLFLPSPPRQTSSALRALVVGSRGTIFYRRRLLFLDKSVLLQAQRQRSEPSLGRSGDRFVRYGEARIHLQKSNECVGASTYAIRVEECPFSTYMMEGSTRIDLLTLTLVDWWHNSPPLAID